MAGFSNYLEQAVLNHVFGGTAFTPPATLYIGIHVGGTAPDTELATGIVEPTGNAYARVGVANTPANFPAATQNGSSEAQKTNANAINFPTATGVWGTATHFFIADAATGGNIYGIGTLAAAKAIDDGDTASFEAGTLILTLE